MAVNFTEATNALELCRFAYKMYAQSVEFPFDPFFEADLADHSGISTRSRMMSHIHDELRTPKADAQTRELDPIEYRLDVVPNPQNSTIYRGDTDNTYLLFTPGTWDKKIGQYNGYDIKGQIIQGGTVSGGTAACSYFQGGTGQRSTIQIDCGCLGWVLLSMIPLRALFTLPFVEVEVVMVYVPWRLLNYSVKEIQIGLLI